MVLFWLRRFPEILEGSRARNRLCAPVVKVNESIAVAAARAEDRFLRSFMGTFVVMRRFLFGCSFGRNGTEHRAKRRSMALNLQAVEVGKQVMSQH